jgi:hypothetical protein
MVFANALFAGLPVIEDPADNTYLGGDETVLVEGRANEISVPHVDSNGIDSRLMEWDDATNQLKASVRATRVSDYIAQLNKRYLGSSSLVPDLVYRAETVDADTGNRLVFTPGATPAGSLQDFDVVIGDQDGDYESRGFLLYLADDANPGAVDGGLVILRLLPSAFPW